MSGQVYIGRGRSRLCVPLGKLLGEGASGKVHALPDMPGTAAKLYFDGDMREREQKIDAMLANPPDLPPLLHHGVPHPQIAWPEAKLFDAAGQFAGFLMPEIDFKRSTSLVNLLQKSSRRAERISHYYGYRVLVARNLASVSAELHRAGHHMIDMKPANLRFYPAMSWMAVVDTDGFSIKGAARRIAAERVSDEYIAPESWKKRPEELGVAQDEFALAVIVFQLLNNGVHPFSGVAADGAVKLTDLQSRIGAGLYPYGISPSRDLAPSAASLHRSFPRDTRELFDRAFTPGETRPSAEEWLTHLDGLLERLVPCEAKPVEHAHFGGGCGFCAHEARVAAAVAARPARAAPPPRPRAVVSLQPPAHAMQAAQARRSGAAGPVLRHAGMRARRVRTAARLQLLGIAAAAAIAVLLAPVEFGRIAEDPEATLARMQSNLSQSIGPAWSKSAGRGETVRGEMGEANPEAMLAALRNYVRSRPVEAPGVAAAGLALASSHTRPASGPASVEADSCLAPAPGTDAALCADPALAEMDRRVSERAVAQAEAAEGYFRPYLLERHRYWRAGLDRCQVARDPAECLRLAYQLRLDELGDGGEAPLLDTISYSTSPAGPGGRVGGGR